MKVLIVRVPDNNTADDGYSIIKVPDDKIEDAEAFYAGEIIVKGDSLADAIQQFSNLKDDL